MASRIENASFRNKVTTAEEAAKLIKHGMNVGFSGFTGAGYPKEVPIALAAQIKEAHERGEEFMIGMWTGASTAPELDGALAEVDGISFRTPYQSDPIMRNKINAPGGASAGVISGIIRLAPSASTSRGPVSPQSRL